MTQDARCMSERDPGTNFGRHSGLIWRIEKTNSNLGSHESVLRQQQMAAEIKESNKR